MFFDCLQNASWKRQPSQNYMYIWATTGDFQQCGLNGLFLSLETPRYVQAVVEQS